jgi:hypothetical protein
VRSCTSGLRDPARLGNSSRPADAESAGLWAAERRSTHANTASASRDPLAGEKAGAADQRYRNKLLHHLVRGWSMNRQERRN